MKHLFFNLPGTFAEINKRIFGSLGIDNAVSNESTNVRGGVYYMASVFGLLIKLEMNSYDYEDKYEYMISLRVDPLRELKVNPESINAVTEIARDLVCKNLLIDVAEEGSEGLRIYNP